YMNDIDRRKSISLGRKYEQFTYLIGFEHGESGKTMGLAPYAPALFEPNTPTIKDLQFPLTFEDGLTEIEDIWLASGEPWHRFVKIKCAEMVASAKKFLKSYIWGLLNALNPHGMYKPLCGAGGVFLNCQMTHRILDGTRFERIHLIPAAGDDGQCIGAA